ncbi:segregation/condensation protein A [Salimicrobium jeotgali]|uniref:Segregation and condensation protein A n=1 Tax=Salimicrobium jeotgali TaxID=1230341 RepID=K2GEB9_9BACI|nr:segregation/condensation protein A [Salimicrobium jeotgali]AKG04376.1 segregation/condensation protein A [Salimicrobium jeotgali]EKE32567.1 segregation and condensation protein A [Salimicrobium jeotgali]MBM7695450.1 segregation and condensation protein A [Salimicrobium jeotgali]
MSVKSEYHIKVEGFEGPMDLLLHLIQRLEIDIHDIPVAEITDQYMEYIHTMNELELDIASEYLVMAATLLAMKSSTLLPEEPVDPEEFESEEDPREELMERLKEYRKFKYAAGQLKDREAEDNEVYSRPPVSIEEGAGDDQQATVFDMIGALQRMFNKTASLSPKMETGVKRDEMPIQLTMDHILQKIQKFPSGITFEKLFSARTRTEMVTTFLALLELVKDKQVSCRQDEHFEDLYIFKQGDNHGRE